MKSLILEKVKEEMQQTIIDVSYENTQEKKEILNDYLQFIELIKKLPLHFLESYELLQIPAEQPIRVPETKEEIPFKQTEVEDSNVYVYHRKLRGGHLEGTEILVSEGISRNLELAHGDLVRPVFNDKNKRYFFELIEKRNSKDPVDRKQISYGIVEKENSIFTVNEYHDTDFSKKLVKVDDVPYSFILSPSDVT